MPAADFPGFIGPSYRFNNAAAAVERLVNFYVDVNESGGQEPKFRMALSPSPSNQQFGTLPVPAPFNAPCRGLIQLRDTLYGVNGTTFYSMDQFGNYTYIASVQNDGNPVSMTANGNQQILVITAGVGYVWDARAEVWTPLGSSGFGGGQYATFQDGYGIVVTPNSNQYQISGSNSTPLGDMTQWNGANVSVQAGQADLLQACFSHREYLYLFGKRRSQVHYNVGSQGIGGFPFQSYNGTFLETGLAAIFSLASLGDSLMWIGQDERGIRACWRDASFQPMRVSNFSVEQIWQNYARVDDAIAFSFIWRGHLMYQVTFPSAIVNTPPSGFPAGSPPTYTGATWVYDATASQIAGIPMWHERSYQNYLNIGVQRSEAFHAYCYGKHLVGSTGVDGNPGAIYQYSDSYFFDCGADSAGNQLTQPIVRDRICPHLYHTNNRLVFNRLELELLRGQGLSGSPAGNVGVFPQVLLRWSNDGGMTWSAEQSMNAGAIGQYTQRVYLNRLGSARDRVFWIRCSDPVYWGIVAANLWAFECSF
jgi:hypothetical protein